MRLTFHDVSAAYSSQVSYVPVAPSIVARPIPRGDYTFIQRRVGMTRTRRVGLFIAMGTVWPLQAGELSAQERRGVVSHPPLLKMVLPDTANREVAVYEVEYEPGGINPRHQHPAAI